MQNRAFPKAQNKNKKGIDIAAVREKHINGEQLTNLERRVNRDIGYRIAPGFLWNPLTKYPKNWPCFCGSGLKFKKCCTDKVPKTCTKELFPKYQLIVDQANLGMHPRPQVVKPPEKKDGV